MLIDLVWLRQTKKSLAFSHGAWTSYLTMYVTVIAPTMFVHIKFK